MKQRLAIAQALLHQNPILLLDEPTKSLDPPATRRFHHLLQEELAGRRGLTILLATHQLWEAEVLCQRVAVMHQGRLQGCGSPSELRRDLGLTERWRLVLNNLTPNPKKRLEEVPLPLSLTSQDGGHFCVEWDDRQPEITNEVLRVVSQAGGHIMGLSQPFSRTGHLGNYFHYPDPTRIAFCPHSWTRSRNEPRAAKTGVATRVDNQE
jgi:ABC-type multidrug transport system ATPase subunit